MWTKHSECYWIYHNLLEGEIPTDKNILISILSYLPIEGGDIFYDVTFHPSDKLKSYEYSRIRGCKSLEEAKFKGLVYIKNLGYDININNYGDK